MSFDKKLSDGNPGEKQANKTKGLPLDITFHDLSYTARKGKSPRITSTTGIQTLIAADRYLFIWTIC